MGQTNENESIIGHENYEKMKRKKQNLVFEKGITLVALVITIIILIILATVAINFAFENNGLIQRAEDARDYYANDTSYTDESITNVESYLDGLINGVGSGNGGSGGDTLPTDGSFSEEKGVNTPKLASNMQLVTFNSDDNTWVADETNSGYSYVDTSVSGNENRSEWANAEVIVNGITSYFVWIPRFAYKINGTNDIDVKFIKGTGTEAVEEGITCKYADDPSLDTTTDYIIHPAFTINKDLGGGWDNELPGIWIGKYEASLANKTDGSNIVTDDTDTGNILLSDHTDKTVVTKPGYNSWRNITIGNMYTNALAYDTNLESHMLKNSEWGAVAYLTESKYGRNGTEVGFSNQGYITGGGTDNAYATANQDQSSTGNVYGIYDLRGGASEYVASYYNGNSSLSYGSSFASNGGDSTKYATAYTGTVASTAYKYGDATYETSGWHADETNFVNSNGPFFDRGGVYYANVSGVGVFAYGSADYGAAYHSIYSFRIALVL